MHLDLTLQNIAYGGADRWPLLVERLTAGGVGDLVLLNECAGWADNDERLLRRAATDLGLAVAGLTRVASPDGQPSAILYRHERLGDPIGWFDGFNGGLHGFGIATWNPPAGLDGPLSVGVGHLTPQSRAKALAEAEEWCTRAYFHGGNALIAGDMNSCPITGPDPDLDRMTVFNRATRLDRTEALVDGDIEETWTPNRDIAGRIRDYGFFDAAVEFHARTGDTDALGRTGRSDRIDWICVAAPLRSAVTGYQRLTAPEGASDHHGVRVRLEWPTTTISSR